MKPLLCRYQERLYHLRNVVSLGYVAVLGGAHSFGLGTLSGNLRGK